MSRANGSCEIDALKEKKQKKKKHQSRCAIISKFHKIPKFMKMNITKCTNTITTRTIKIKTNGKTAFHSISFALIMISSITKRHTKRINK